MTQEQTAALTAALTAEGIQTREWESADGAHHRLYLSQRLSRGRRDEMGYIDLAAGIAHASGRRGFLEGLLRGVLGDAARQGVR